VSLKNGDFINKLEIEIVLFLSWIMCSIAILLIWYSSCQIFPTAPEKIQISEKPARIAKYEKERKNPYNKTCHFEFLAAPDGLGVSYDVSLFYHIGMLNNWHQIVLDQFDTLEYCGLGYIASDMTISFHNPSPNVTESESVQQILEL
jgi:hypothetical protein